VAKPRYSTEPEDAARFTRDWDRSYTAWTRLYDVAVRRLPVWRTWLEHALPHVQGPRVLEVSFGTGCLITRIAERFDAHGIDYNRAMVETARENLRRQGRTAALVRAKVERLPYPDASFDSVVNTMAFSGYPDGGRALAEMTRVLREGGRLILIDFSNPGDGNWLGSRIVTLVERSGDLIRDMGRLFRECDLDYTDEPIGAWGSVHLYVATRTGAT
jgi:ubiquinone/menaquinone biosynthesis C-methylase UbiE